MDTAAYLARIGLAAEEIVHRSPDLSMLELLHEAQVTHVPFENIDILRGIALNLEFDRLFDKIIIRNRGGFCYELSGLFSELLKSLGFDVTLLSARVFHSDGTLGPEFDHLALLVKLDPNDQARWFVVDPGFGESPRRPIALRNGSDGEWQISSDGSDYYLDRIAAIENSEATRSEWKHKYTFTLEAHSLSEFYPACEWQQLSPSFKTKLKCSRWDGEEYITVWDNSLGRTRGARRETKPITAEERDELLWREFGISM